MSRHTARIPYSCRDYFDWGFIRKHLAESGFIDPCTQEQNDYNEYIELLIKQINQIYTPKKEAQP